MSPACDGCEVVRDVFHTLGNMEQILVAAAGLRNWEMVDTLIERLEEERKKRRGEA